MNGRQFIRWVKQQRYPGMGADVHAYFEKRTQDGKWEPLWGWRPDPDYWWERIAEQKTEAGAHIVIEPLEGESEYNSIVRYYKAIPMDEVMARYGTHPLLERDFLGPKTAGEKIDYSDKFGSRDYAFFAAVASVRGRGADPRGIPDDLSPAVRGEYERWEGDAHSHTWFLCSEMLADPTLNHFRQVDVFVRKYIDDPENTRVVMFFDN
ncbi:MAG: hypothetical protein EOO77_40975 [Oxalobacteraceae bacterium]|nr:MAG: hypothetical protein EOO77_40975 [Oxalobacteraceae bacterium]